MGGCRTTKKELSADPSWPSFERPEVEVTLLNEITVLWYVLHVVGNFY